MAPPSQEIPKLGLREGTHAGERCQEDRRRTLYDAGCENEREHTPPTQKKGKRNRKEKRSSEILWRYQWIRNRTNWSVTRSELAASSLSAKKPLRSSGKSKKTWRKDNTNAQKATKFRICLLMCRTGQPRISGKEGVIHKKPSVTCS